MEPLLCYPPQPPVSVVAVLDRAGYPFEGIAAPEAADDGSPKAAGRVR